MNKKRPQAFFPSIFFGLAILLTGVSSCDLPPSPVAPTWELEINVPLLNKSYNILNEVVDKTDEITADSLNNLFFEFESEIDTFSVGDQLKIDGMSESFSQSLGSFSIESLEQTTMSVTLREIFPQAGQLNGLTVPVPAFQFDIENKKFNSFDNFQWAEIERGIIRLKVVNNLSIDLGKPINLELRDGATNALITTVEVPDFVSKNGGEYLTALDLSGKRITNDFSISLRGGSPGSAVPVQVNADDGFAIDISLDDFEVKSAAAKIGRQTISQSNELAMADSVIVESAKIRQGTIAVNISGTFPIDTQIEFKVPNFVNATGETLQVSIASLQNEPMPLRLDLSGYTFKSTGTDFGDQKVAFWWELATLQQPDEISVLKSSDFLSANFVLSELRFDEVKGKFNSKKIEIPAQTFTVEIPEQVESITFEDASLQLTLNNSINFPVQTDIQITGKNDNGSSVTMAIQSLINAGTSGGSPVPTVIEINRQTNNTIVDLLNLLPTSIEVTGQADIGQSEAMGSVRATDKVSGTIKFRAPLAFQLPEQSYEADVSKITVEQDVQERLTENLLSGKLFAQINSHLPLGASLDLYFAASDSTVYTIPDVAIGPINLASGQIDAQTGVVSAPQQSEIEVSLTKEQIDFFARDVLYSGIKVNFPGTNNQVVRLLASDFVEVKAYVNFKVMANENALSSN
ncbi:MAG: hypothetical protein ACE5I1_10430 [bacterium]